MRLLAIDTATPRIMTGVVELSGGTPRQLSVSSQLGATAHAEVLAPSIAQVVGEAGLTMSELQGVVVGLGPGPFTGLRVGIVTAAALADALDVRAWGACSLDALAPETARTLVPEPTPVPEGHRSPVPESAHTLGSDPGRPRTTDAGRTLVVTDARRKELYFAVYVGNRRVIGPDVAAPADVLTAAGDVDAVVHAGAEKYLDVLAAAGPVRDGAPTPVSLVAAAVRDGAIGAAPSALQPIYIRRPDAAEPKARPRLDVIGPS